MSAKKFLVQKWEIEEQKRRKEITKKSADKLESETPCEEEFDRCGHYV